MFPGFSKACVRKKSFVKIPERMKEKAVTCITGPTAGCRDCNRCGGGGETSDSDDVIKIGVFRPLTGANAAGGDTWEVQEFLM